MRNTEWGIGIAIYTGPDTKIFRNSKNPPHKVSNVMRKMNTMLCQVFILQVVIIFLCAGLNYYWAYNNSALHPEIGNSNIDLSSLSKSFPLSVLSFWVTFSHMIPISLYVAIEVLKLSQGILVGRDVGMYHRDTQAFASCKNSDLTEELGQVQMIFSDKTGTLTQNKMEFKKCQIHGVRFGDNKESE